MSNSKTHSTPLKGKKIAFLVTDGFEQIELTAPRQALEEAGAQTELVAPQANSVRGYHHLDKGDTFPVDKCADAISAHDYDGLVLPGGVANPDALRIDEKAVALVRSFFKLEKPVAAICHGPWTLIDAGVVAGRTLTSWPSLRTDIQNAGGTWVDQDVVVDKGLVTSRKPDDLKAFCSKSIEEFARENPQ